jgi:multiple sugar transport system permease protein
MARPGNATRTDALQGYLFVAAALVLLVLFHLAPVAYALFLSLFDARVFRDIWQPGPFVGLANYGRLLGAPEFALGLANTVWYAALSVPVGLALALGLAQLLHAPVRGRTLYRVVYFLPFVASPVAAAVIWRWIFQPRVGVADALLQAVGLPALSWMDEPRGVFEMFGQFVGLPVGGALAGPSLALVTVAIVTVWQYLGFDTVVFLAGLTAVPVELYEAARLDGAGGWRLFREITLPLLAPTALFLVVVATIRSFQSFTLFYQLARGDPVPGSKVVTIYLYEQAFESFNLGYAAAIGMALFVIIFGLTLVELRATRGRIAYAE